MENKKKVAIVGYGGQGGWHARQIAASDVVTLRGVYDIKPERNELAESQGIRAYKTFEDVLADTQVDIIVCATPNDSHKEIVIRSLEAGKHVICEKPVAITLEDFQEMRSAAERSGKTFTVHQNRRWDVDFLAIKSLVDGGGIGELINVESRVHGSRGIPSDWRCHKEFGGGMILDWGVHLIDQILQLIPEKIAKVYCETTNITTNEVDDGFHLMLTFESGKRATVEVGTYNFVHLPRFYLQCKNGSAIIENWQQRCKVAKMKAWNEKEVVPVQTAAGITKTMAPRDHITLDTYEIERPVADVHDFYRNVVKAIDGEETCLITLDQVELVLKVMEACFRSAETGRTMTVS